MSGVTHHDTSSKSVSDPCISWLVPTLISCFSISLYGISSIILFLIYSHCVRNGLKTDIVLNSSFLISSFIFFIISFACSSFIVFLSFLFLLSIYTLLIAPFTSCFSLSITFPYHFLLLKANCIVYSIKYVLDNNTLRNQKMS